MSVYVDDMRASFGRMVMCHMIADTSEELCEMAYAIGVKQQWIQKRGQPDEHFDISLAKRRLAVRLGAKEITLRELAMRVRAKRLRLSNSAAPNAIQSSTHNESAPEETGT